VPRGLADEDRVIGGGFVEIVAAGIAFFGQVVLIVAVAADPLALWGCGGFSSQSFD
jgi:hypothetical protein